MSWNLWSHVHWCGDGGVLLRTEMKLCVCLRMPTWVWDTREHTQLTRRGVLPANSGRVCVHAPEWLMRNSSQVRRVLPLQCICLSVPGKLEAPLSDSSSLEWVAISAAFRRGRNTTNCFMKFLRWVQKIRAFNLHDEMLYHFESKNRHTRRNCSPCLQGVHLHVWDGLLFF